jgi:Leucine Rich repeat
MNLRRRSKWPKRALILLAAAVLVVGAYIAWWRSGYLHDRQIVDDLAEFMPEIFVDPLTGRVTYIAFQSQYYGHPVTDEVLPRVVRLGKLQYLALYHTSVTDQGLAQLAPLRRLRQLDLTGTKIGDKGIAALVSLPALAVLYLAGANVSDRSIESIKRMRQLKELGVGGTMISASALAELAKENPSLEIRRPRRVAGPTAETDLNPVTKSDGDDK